ncbi:MAG: 2-oxoglutarate dehydrogenase E1 subunit family protein, partial [Jiangellaceae bacterium]
MPEEPPPTFGPNAWLVDEMYDDYQRDPNSVSESWREFFADYKPSTTNGTPIARPTPAPASPAP